MNPNSMQGTHMATKHIIHSPRFILNDGSIFLGSSDLELISSLWPLWFLLLDEVSVLCVVGLRASSVVEDSWCVLVCDLKMLE